MCLHPGVLCSTGEERSKRLLAKQRLKGRHDRAAEPAAATTPQLRPVDGVAAAYPATDSSAASGRGSRGPHSGARRLRTPSALLTPPGTGDLVSSKSNVSVFSDWDAYEGGGGLVHDPVTGRTLFQHVPRAARHAPISGTTSGNVSGNNTGNVSAQSSVDPGMPSSRGIIGALDSSAAPAPPQAGSGAVVVRAPSVVSSAAVADGDALNARPGQSIDANMRMLALENPHPGAAPAAAGGASPGRSVAGGEWGGEAERKMAEALLLHGGKASRSRSPGGDLTSSASGGLPGAAAAAAASKPRPLADDGGPRSDRSATGRSRRSRRSGIDMEKESERACPPAAPLVAVVAVNLARRMVSPVWQLDHRAFVVYIAWDRSAEEEVVRRETGSVESYACLPSSRRSCRGTVLAGV